MILVVTGLKREARIATGDDVVAISGGGDRASLTRQIADAFQRPIRGVVSFGIAGALAPSLVPGDLVIASRILDGEALPSDERWVKAVSSLLQAAKVGEFAGTSDPLFAAGEKANLYARTGAIVVDMESHVAAREAQRRQVPFIAIRAISDSAHQSLPHAAYAAMKPDGGLNVFGIARSILARPGQIPDLIRTGRESEKAFAALLRCRDVVGPRFALPDLV